MKDRVKILLLGDERVGKSSLISSFVSQCFTEKVPPVHTPVQIPASESLEKVTTIIIDSSANEKEQLIQKIKDADAIILVYDHGRRETLTHLRRWLELVKETWAGVNKPVVLAGNKYDLKPADEEGQEEGGEDEGEGGGAAGGAVSSSSSSSTISEIKALLEQYRFVLNNFDECSAKTLDEVPEVFGNAQKLVLYPVWPLYDTATRDFTPKLRRVLGRIFRVFDADHDGLLNDGELNALQERCFRSTLHQEDLEEVKKIVAKNVPGGVRQGAITPDGLQGIVRLFIEQMQVDMPWTMLRTLGYNDELELQPPGEDAALLQEGLRGELACELGQEALAFLTRVFHQFKDPDTARLGPAQLQEVWSVLPPGEERSPWSCAGEGRPIQACLVPEAHEEQGGLGLAEWLAGWQMVAALHPEVAVLHLRALGCCCNVLDSSSSSAVPRPLPTPADRLLSTCSRWRQRRRKATTTHRHHKGPAPRRHVLHALLFCCPAATAGGPCLLSALCGLQGAPLPPPSADSRATIRACVRQPAPQRRASLSAGGGARGGGGVVSGEEGELYLVVSQVPPPPPPPTPATTTTAQQQQQQGQDDAEAVALQQRVSEAAELADVAIVTLDGRAGEEAALQVLERLPARLPVLFLQRAALAPTGGTAGAPPSAGPGPSGQLLLLPERLGEAAKNQLPAWQVLSLPLDPLLAAPVLDAVPAHVAALYQRASAAAKDGSGRGAKGEGYEGYGGLMTVESGVVLLAVVAAGLSVAAVLWRQQHRTR